MQDTEVERPKFPEEFHKEACPIGPYEIKIAKLKTKRKKEPGSGN